MAEKDYGRNHVSQPLTREGLVEAAKKQLKLGSTVSYRAQISSGLLASANTIYIGYSQMAAGWKC